MRKISEGTEHLYCHYIDWWVDVTDYPELEGKIELGDCDIEHICEQLHDNCYTGEICVSWELEDETQIDLNGWWKIQRN